VIGVAPKPLEVAKRGLGGLQVVSGYFGLLQHVSMTPMHSGQPFAQLFPFFGESDVN